MNSRRLLNYERRASASDYFNVISVEMKVVWAHLHFPFYYAAATIASASLIEDNLFVAMDSLH